jgi:DNA repair protein MmcB-like
MPKITEQTVQVALSKHFDCRRNLVLPNAYYGVHGLDHEVDLLVVKPTGYAIEVEIKLTRADLKKDFEKKHGHKSRIIDQIYYCVTPKLVELAVELVPEDCGILVYDPPADRGRWRKRSSYVSVLRAAKSKKPRPRFSEQQIYDVLRLSVLRVWTLKEKLDNINSKNSK